VLEPEEEGLAGLTLVLEGAVVEGVENVPPLFPVEGVETELPRFTDDERVTLVGCWSRVTDCLLLEPDIISPRDTPPRLTLPSLVLA